MPKQCFIHTQHSFSRYVCPRDATEVYVTLGHEVPVCAEHKKQLEDSDLEINGGGLDEASNID